MSDQCMKNRKKQNLDKVESAGQSRLFHASSLSFSWGNLIMLPNIITNFQKYRFQIIDLLHKKSTLWNLSLSIQIAVYEIREFNVAL